MDNVITWTEEQYRLLNDVGVIEPNTAFYITADSIPMSSIITREQTIQEVIHTLSEKSAVEFRCTHCGTECFEHQAFTPKCPNCGSLMNRCEG